MRQIVLALLFVGSALWTSPTFAQEPASTTIGEALLQSEMKELRLQADGGLLAWDHGSGAGVIYQAGETLTEEPVSGPSNVPPPVVSPSGHLAFLVDFRRSVLVRRADGATHTLEVGEPLAEVLWLDDRRLAIGLQNSDRLIEIWDVEAGERLRRVIPAEPIDTSPGYRLVRATRLAWDGERKLLHTLDAFTGEYRAARLTEDRAEILYRRAIDDQNSGQYEEYIARTRNRSHAPSSNRRRSGVSTSPSTPKVRPGWSKGARARRPAFLP